MPAGRDVRPYADPYLSGVGLGLVLLAAFVLTGRGLGASGAFATTAAGVASAITPGYAASNAYFSRYLALPGSPWLDSLLFEVVGSWSAATLRRAWRGASERKSSGELAPRQRRG